MNKLKEFMAKNYFTAFIIGLALTAVFVMFAPGCNGSAISKEEVTHYRTVIADTRVRAEGAKQEAAKLIVAASEAGDEQAKVEATKQLEAADKAIKASNEAEAFLIKASSPTGEVGVDGAITAAGSLLPPPWNVLALVAAPLAAWGFKEFQRRRDLHSMIDGIEAAKQADAEFRGALIRNKGRLLEHYNDSVFNVVEARVGSKQ
jgi:hypothetical protein